MASKRILTTGVALASTAAIVAATPAFMPNPGPEVHVAAPAAMAPLKQLTVTDIQLLNVFSLTGLSDAIFSGYGGIVTGDPVDLSGQCGGADAACLSYFGGATYYLTDTLLLPNTSLDNHLFEQGLITGLVEFTRESLQLQPLPEDPLGNAILDSILQPLATPVIFAEAFFPDALFTKVLRGFYDGLIFGAIDALITGTESASTLDPNATTLLSSTTTTLEAGTSAVGQVTTPDLTKMVSLSVESGENLKPVKKTEDAGTGGDTLTVDTTAVDTTGVQDLKSADGTVETVETEDAVAGGGTLTVGTTSGDTTAVQDPTNADGAVETVKTEKPKLNEKKFNPLAHLKDKSVRSEEKKDGSSEAGPADRTAGVKNVGRGLGKHHKHERAGAGVAAADAGGGEAGDSGAGGGDAG